MSDSAKPAHILVIPFEAWGHVRPLLHLVIQLLTLHPKLHVTFLLSPDTALRVDKELKSANLVHVREQEGEASVLARMQLIQVEVKEVPLVANATIVDGMAAKGEAYAVALAGYLSCLLGATGQIEDKFKVMAPSCLIYDMFLGFVPEVFQDVSQKAKVDVGKVSVFMFAPCGPTTAYLTYSREEAGGAVAEVDRLVKEGIKQGEDPMQVVAPFGIGDKGVMRSVPGLPTMTDYELHPGLGACPVPPPITLALCKSYKAAWHPVQTGIICPAVHEMEAEAEAWVTEHMGRPYLSLGFQYPDDVWGGNVAPPAADDADGQKAITFLDEMLVRRGPKSVLYISFGSAWFPFMRPDIILNLIDTLITTETPFLFAYATELFPVPPELLEKVKASAFGAAVHIAPQVQVLHHAATGFFVSHCGANSMAEAIVASVPIIGVPFAADQGEHIALLKKFKAGIDLKQVKCFFGRGEKPKVLYDGTVLVGTEEFMKAEMIDLWAQLKGKLGEELYAGMADLTKVCRASCAEGGASRQAMLDLAKYF